MCETRLDGSRRRFLRAAGAAVLMAATRARAATAPPTLSVFAAASLSDVLGAIAGDYQREAGVKLQLVLAASSALARQIEAGAAADIFISADQAWMDYLAGRHLIEPSTRRDVAGNSLVLIAPADSDVKLRIAPGFAVAKALQGGRLAVGDVDTVPAGRYAKAALTSLGVWQQVKDHLASTDSVRSALAFVARGEAPLGIVYATDARVEPRVRVVDTFPADSHEPITYPAAVVKGASPLALPFLDSLHGAQARATFEHYGFTFNFR